MKKEFQVPEYEFIVFDNNDIVRTSVACPDDGCSYDSCTTYCDDEACRVCDYLVCEPRDVII